MIHYLVVGLVNLLFGGIALAKKRDCTTKAFAFLAAAGAAWSFELYLLSSLSDKALLESIFPVLRTGMFLIAPALALLTWRLVGSRSRLFVYWVLLPGFVVSIALGLTNTLIFPSELRPVAHGYLPAIDVVYYIFVANFLWCVLASLGLVGLHYPHITVREQQKLKWLLIILTLTLGLACATIVLMAFDFYLSQLIGVLPNLILLGTLLYAIVRHDLMDIRTLISTGVVRLCILTLFGLGYITVISVPSFQSNQANVVLAVVFFAVLLEVYPRLLVWVLPNTNRLLAASTYDFHQVTREIHQRLHHCTTWAELNHLLDTVFFQTIRVDGYELYLAQEDETTGITRYVSANNPQNSFRLSQRASLALAQSFETSAMVMEDETQGELKNHMLMKAALSCFSLNRDNKRVALLLVGHVKAFTSYYRFDDIRLMEWLSKELPQAIQRVELVEQFHAELAEAKKKLSLLGMMNLYHHDIKAPLSIIDGVVSNDLYDEEKRRQVILEQVAWGSELITTMAQLLNGGRTLKRQALSVEKILRDCAHVFGRTIANLHCRFDETEQIEGDPEDLKILFINVLKNAYEATDSQKPLEVQMSTSTDAHGVRVEIRDNGLGISEDRLAHLWSAENSQKPGGNGIGLQTIKHIADQHQAKVTVHSNPEEGTRFIFHFPLLQAKEQTVKPAELAENFLTETAYPDTH